jgi:hypothetical protein
VKSVENRRRKERVVIPKGYMSKKNVRRELLSDFEKVSDGDVEK